MSITNYLEKVNKHFQSGHATEHSYRGDFAELIQLLVPDLHITNEPSNVTDCGNPDYVITKNKIPIGFIEAKDLGKDLNGKQYREQFGRYRKALNNLIITDYVWFQFFGNGDLLHEIRIAEIDGKKVVPIPENFNQFTNLINEFCVFVNQTITSPKILAELMAAKARLLENILENAITSDEQYEQNTALKEQYETFKAILIHDLTPKGFADIYAQTLAYGMFAARLHDKSLDTFSRQEAAELIPKSNPFLRKLFNHIAGVDIDDRIVTTVDNLAEVFRATNVESLLNNFGKTTESRDPIIHFYETFLAEYDPKLRKSRGVWYTPEPVVNFIVRGVDEILKNDFGLKDGLADTSKTTIKVEAQGTAVTKGKAKGKKLFESKQVHMVQVLDPATGTGTFLAEVIKYIYSTRFQTMQGAWSSYVEDHLIPRLTGFELLMASYSIAHLKLDMLLTETGYQSNKNSRFNIFLTNSLEEHHPDTGTLFSSWLSTEANEANHVKRDTPVMVVMGNPPYRVSSSNKGEWIEDLIASYKQNLEEQNKNALSDDYIKFIRYGQHFIEKRGSGILAYITNNSFIDSLIHRRMREDLLTCFDKIYILDLHGSSKKNETSPDGTPDQNVFDIMQGVSINIFIKTSRSKKLGKLNHEDVYGKRSDKYDFLRKNTINSISWKQLKVSDPYYYFVNKDFKEIGSYQKGFAIDELFNEKGSGIKFRKNNLLVKNNFTTDDVKEMIRDMISLDSSLILKKYKFKETKDWKIEEKRKYFVDDGTAILPVNYRPFDIRYTYYPIDSVSEIIPRGDSRKNLMHHILEGSLGFICFRQSRNSDTGHYWITKYLMSKDILSSLDSATVFPLYLFPNQDAQLATNDFSRITNFNKEIVLKLGTNLKLEFVEHNIQINENRKPTDSKEFSPENVLDYIYAVVHSPTYRKKYKEFLKIDFPRIPYPKNRETFWKFVRLGKEIRNVHLMESAELGTHIASFPKNGDNKITQKIDAKNWEIFDDENQLGRVWINKKQYFEGVSSKVWNLNIGGYQPAQKWLKDRTGRHLTFEDIIHYQKIIFALSETDRIMQEIDKIAFE